MCDPQTFDSRDSRYKRPYGAVPSGTRVELALRPPRAGGFSAATLIAYFEHRDEERRELAEAIRRLPEQYQEALYLLSLMYSQAGAYPPPRNFPA